MVMWNLNPEYKLYRGPYSQGWGIWYVHDNSAMTKCATISSQLIQTYLSVTILF